MMKLGIVRAIGCMAIVTVLIPAAGATEKNGFDLDDATIPLAEILKGGPGRDGIPSIDRPRFISPARATYMQPDDQVISVSINGVTRAYPLRILVWHEIANDTVGGRPIVVTYCPLCGTAMVFDRRVGERTLTFGVSGLLYQSDVLMYDRETESLWSQLKMQSVAGTLVNQSLVWLPSRQLTWDAWKEAFPNGRVLSTNTGSRRNYTRQPYSGYESREKPMFPVPHHRQELKNKAWVAGIIVNGHAAAYPLKELGTIGTVEDGIGGVDLRIHYDPESQAVQVTDLQSGAALPVVKAYWFAWQAFYPRSALWTNGR